MFGAIALNKDEFPRPEMVLFSYPREEAAQAIRTSSETPSNQPGAYTAHP